ncbi:hypothetical protein LSH36_106g00042 [Paralvinella palmiformis]|uniref:Carboxylesterase type B domain-containing protein n=1 Tax=Paralvinella palmiformis TaxID=53620 RepID=A0AAD9NB13_9ANNE|nr:hypothetical protein LSH36_106g00042 [Paralvinella palmiformis]
MDALLCLMMWIAGWTTVLGAASTRRQTVELKTRLGKVCGYTETVLGKTVDTYWGLPYAKPPVGTLRFQRPESYGRWSGVWDATEMPNACPQVIDHSLNSFEGVTMWNPNTNISEDCLYLNIWTPTRRQQPTSPTPGRLRAVMVWIFGGGFYGGTSTLDWYDGRIMAAEGDVVVVSMQYRVGVMGFLYLGVSGAPGNVGLVDQQLAMQWIFNNIRDYGGDNRRITLFGESAGAASVSFHLLSPLSKETFHRAIMQSATALSPWALDTRQSAKAKSLEIASMVGCRADDDDEQVLLCMRRASVDEMTSKMWSVVDESVLQTPLAPIVDGYFLRRHPVDLVADAGFKPVPILLGVNHDEGAYFLPFSLPKLYNLSRNSIDTEEKYLRGVRRLMGNDDRLIGEIVAYEYKYPYHYTRRLSYMDIMDDIMGDYNFICPTLNFARAYAESGQPVYVYQFDHVSSRSPWPRWMGALHGYEIDTVFGQPLNDSLNYTMPEKELSQRVVQLWTNFGKTSNPTKREDGGSMVMHWPQYSPESRKYVVLNTTSPAIVLDGLRDRKCSFWRELIPKLRKWDGCHNNPGCQVACASTSTHGVHPLTVTVVTLLSAAFCQTFSSLSS